MTPNWTPQALRDLTEVDNYIRNDNPRSADRMRARVLAIVGETLPQNPYLGRPGRVDTTREIVVHPSYILVYRIAGERIDILAFRHTARLWPERF